MSNFATQEDFEEYATMSDVLAFVKSHGHEEAVLEDDSVKFSQLYYDDSIEEWTQRAMRVVSAKEATELMGY